MKTAFITGSSKRLGAATARFLHQRGFNVVIHYHTSEFKAQTLTDELNSNRKNSSFMLQADVKNIDSFAKLAEEINARWGRIDVLINNASVFYPQSIEDTAPDDWEKIMIPNLKAPFFLCRAFLPYLRKNNGTIINMADIYGEKPAKHHPVYSISKAGIIMLTKVLALESGIRVNAIAPGAILWHENMNKAEQTQLLEQTILKKTGSLQDITDAVWYLIEHADYTTGQVLRVDGGREL